MTWSKPAILVELFSVLLRIMSSLHSVAIHTFVQWFLGGLSSDLQSDLQLKGSFVFAVQKIVLFFKPVFIDEEW